MLTKLAMYGDQEPFSNENKCSIFQRFKLPLPRNQLLNFILVPSVYSQSFVFLGFLLAPSQTAFNLPLFNFALIKSFFRLESGFASWAPLVAHASLARGQVSFLWTKVYTIFDLGLNKVQVVT